VAIAPVFILVLRQSARKRYITGLLFFGSWLIPTTYWYYLIFPWWQAAAQSLGWVALMAGIFVLPIYFSLKTSPNSSFVKRRTLIELLIIVIAWTIIDTLRQYLPVTEDWWIPHVGYTVWQNPLVIQAARVFGVGGVIAVVLTINAFASYWILHNKERRRDAAHTAVFQSHSLPKKCAAISLVVSLISITGSLIIKKIPTGTTPVTLIALQQQPIGGIHASASAKDVTLLIDKSKQALHNMTRERPIFMVWPENMITPEFDHEISNFAYEEKSTLVYNRAITGRDEALPSHPYNTAALVDETGTPQTISIKKHAAPGEQITTHDVFIKRELHGLTVTADICYDLHYPDIGERIKNTDLVLGSIDDDHFGQLVPLFHAADIVFRAVEHNTYIVTAGTTGPTFFVNRLGVIQNFLPIGKGGMLTVAAEI